MPHPSRRGTIVTAASHAYVRTLCQLLLSIDRHAPDCPVVVFDLGLTSGDWQRIASRFPAVRREQFDFGGWPAHLRRLEICAWKPVAIEQAINRTGGCVLWLDAACIVRAPIDAAFRAIERDGVLTLAGQSPAARWCHPRTFEMMDVPPDDRGKRCRVGGVVGFNDANPAARSLLAKWRELCLVADCIDPPGANRTNHRYDQAVLTNLLSAFEREHGLVLRDDEVDISSVDPVAWVSTRNRVAGWIPLRADPMVRAWYAAVKAVDRASLRARAKVRRRASSYPRGWARTTPR